MVKVHLTELEKRVLRDMFNDGFAFDDLDDSDFITWGVTGKEERGALSSLEKKGIVNIVRDGKDTQVYCSQNYTKRQLLKLCEYKNWEYYM